MVVFVHEACISEHFFTRFVCQQNYHLLGFQLLVVKQFFVSFVGVDLISLCTAYLLLKISASSTIKLGHLQHLCNLEYTSCHIYQVKLFATPEATEAQGISLFISYSIAYAIHQLRGHPAPLCMAEKHTACPSQHFLNLSDAQLRFPSLLRMVHRRP
jgi:hypothetical protein